jgi:flagellar hook-associated protein FlgK
MSDLLALGSTGVSAYQRALSTVSNNIANVGTDGYTRQEVGLAANQPRQMGNSFIGTGVRLEAVRRQYDAFIEANLRNSNSNLEGQGPLVQYASRIMDLMADKNVGLTSSLTAFFSASRDLAVEPASVIARSSFLRQADGAASGFRQLTTQLDLIDDETRQGLTATAEKINTFAEQIVIVNKQLFKNGALDRQPPELLDQRDRLLRDLSALVKIKAEFAVNGQVRISLNDSMDDSTGGKMGAVVVDGDIRHRLGLTVSDSGQTALSLDLNSPNARVITGVSGGELGGLLLVRNQVLKPAQNKLDELAQTLMAEANAIHKTGIDALGRPGEALFGIESTTSSAAQGIITLITDPQKVAAAGPFRVVASDRNVGTAQPVWSLQTDALEQPPTLEALYASTPLNPTRAPGDPLTFAVTGFQSLATVEAGSQDTILTLEPTSGQWPQLLTRDGRHLLGSALTVGQQELLIGSGSLNAGASYSAAYLNAEPEDAYLGATYHIGVRARPLAAPSYDVTGENPHRLLSESLVPAHIQSQYNFDSDGPASQPIAAGALVLNGASLTAYSGSREPQAIADWLNTQTTLTGVTASVASQEDTSTETVQDYVSSLVLTAVDTSRDVVLGFGSVGTPDDLAQLGFKTHLYWDGTAPEDLVLFATGDGDVELSAQVTVPPFDAVQALRNQPFEIEFGANNRYTLTDVRTGTLLAERTYDPEDGTIAYRGIALTFNSTPLAGDRFKVNGNQDGTGDNRNIVQMAELEFKTLPNGYTLTDSYLEQTGNVGRMSVQASVAQEALAVVHKQAVESRDAIGGVSLDEEAANLIRYQQAYQANARVMQAATTLFEALLGIR